MRRGYAALGPAWRTAIDAVAVLAIKMTLFAPLPSFLKQDTSAYVDVALALVKRGRGAPGSIVADLVVLGLLAIVAAPLLEETVYRGVPILCARSLAKRGHRTASVAVAWALGVPSTLLFAWSHHPVFGALPLAQLFSGAVAWAIAWHRGLRFSILFHALGNALSFALYAAAIVHFVEMR